MVKPLRDKKGRFISWPRGESNKGSYRKFKQSLQTRRKGKYRTPKTGKVRVRTQTGNIYEKTRSREYRLIKRG